MSNSSDSVQNSNAPQIYPAAPAAVRTSTQIRRRRQAREAWLIRKAADANLPAVEKGRQHNAFVPTAKSVIGQHQYSLAPTAAILQRVSTETDQSPILPPPDRDVRPISAAGAAAWCKRIKQHQTFFFTTGALQQTMARAATASAPAGAASSATVAAPTPETTTQVGQAPNPVSANASGTGSASTTNMFNAFTETDFTGTVTQATLDTDARDVQTAGEIKPTPEFISWRAEWFKLLARDSMLMKFLEFRQAQNKILSDQTSIRGSKLGVDMTETKVQFDNYQAWSSLGMASISAVSGARRGLNDVMTNPASFLTPNDFSVRAALENQQMKVPVQTVLRRWMMHKMAGVDPFARAKQDGEPAPDALHITKLPDEETRDSDPVNYISPENIKIYDPVASKNLDFYRNYNAGSGPKGSPDKSVGRASGQSSYPILIDVDYVDALGEQKKLHLNRSLISEPEKNSLHDADRQHYEQKIEPDFIAKHIQDWAGLLGLYEQECLMLRSAANTIKAASPKNAGPPDPNDPTDTGQNYAAITSLEARAKDLEKRASNTHDNLLSAFINGPKDNEDSYGKLLNSRGAMENIRLEAKKAMEELKKDPKHPKREALPYYTELFVDMSRRCVKLDRLCFPAMDASADNRRGRWKTGSASAVNFFHKQKEILRNPKVEHDGSQAAQPAGNQEVRQALDTLAFLRHVLPPFFINTIERVEEVETFFKDHQTLQRNNPLEYVRRRKDLISKFSAAVAQPLASAEPKGDGSAPTQSMQGVTAARIKDHVKERLRIIEQQTQLKQNQNTDINDEKEQLDRVKQVDMLFREVFADAATRPGRRQAIMAPPQPSSSGTVLGYMAAAGSAVKKVLPGALQKQLPNAVRNNAALRQERVTGDAAEEQDLNALDLNPEWLTNAQPSFGDAGRKWTLEGTPVDANDADDLLAYYDSRASAGAAILGNRSNDPQGNGAYVDQLGTNVANFATTLSNFFINVSNSFNADRLQGGAREAADRVVGMSQETLSAMVSLISELRDDLIGFNQQILQYMGPLKPR